ncbi:glycosyltransferase [Paenibacillus sp. P36]|uniref:glycosyltransferase n=1 Tax=Paenibacillus sp. P36 TaxID=3342538 RepID=UPI0038B3E8AF
MKKKLLFVMPSLSAGGGEKSLVTLLNRIDFKVYEVDLFLLSHEGIFMEFIPSEVRLLPLPETYHLFSLPLLHSVKGFLLRGNGGLAFNRLMFSIKNRFPGNIAKKEQYSWKHISKSLEHLQDKYYAAIGFLEKTSTYFCVDKVVAADRKIGWVHIDYDQLGMDSRFDNDYFEKLDHIVTVSEECAHILEKRFPKQKNKVEVIYNIVSPSIINKMATPDALDVYEKQGDEIIILSIGRLHYQKNFDLAVESCKLLVDRGYKIQWNIIGDGEEKERLMKLIEENHLENNFKLLGLKSNPYPYIKQADIYAQTSRFEGKSIAIDEAKILNKPIIVTNFSTAKDQVNDEIDGLIVDMDAIAMADGIEKLIKDSHLRKRLTTNLANLQLGTEEEIEKLYDIINR